ncbi:cytidine/deoxycytidylate deaminase [Xylaria bambusicola]|uniref:cytidine/deoxycytidylate deaminase n=1 Tax=Xylaria bambusicola TaxID=326684 RepID=UPI0020088E64|nr:cytidine/deoxycytidylate deaminase [Xylaria bambusicola]KAI0521497.1 cytidine/deoxycytidylate deaminase [Xylaria bambusicola]
MSLTETDLAHLRRTLELASEALVAGDAPFGSVLVDARGLFLREDRNRTATLGDGTRHPELELARWAATNMAFEERAAATVYTSGEHCAMCAAAHAWVGLGRVVFVASVGQLAGWQREFRDGSDGYESPVAPLPIRVVAPGVPVQGPVPEFEEQIKDLHRRWAKKRGLV